VPFLRGILVRARVSSAPFRPSYGEGYWRGKAITTALVESGRLYSGKGEQRVSENDPGHPSKQGGNGPRAGRWSSGAAVVTPAYPLRHAFYVELNAARTHRNSVQVSEGDESLICAARPPSQMEILPSPQVRSG
jgi:hypothetical protein